MVVVVFEVALGGFLYYNDFRITYAPNLENSWDAISAFAAWAGVLASLIAIWSAIQVPKRIAEGQNRIALFEKKYQIYREIRHCYTFCYILKLAEDVTEARKMFLISFEKEMIINNEVGTMDEGVDWDFKAMIRVQKLSEVLRQSQFLFADNQWIFKYTEELVTALTIMIGSTPMNDEEFKQAKNRFLDIMNGETSKKVFDQMTQELQLKSTM